MSKKVVRLTESQLRLMISKVIQEQKTPTKPAAAKPAADPQQQSNNKFAPLLLEALTYGSKGIFTYISKYKPDCIATFSRNGAENALPKGSSIPKKPESYGAGNFGTHELDVRYYPVSKEKNAVGFSIHFNLNSYDQSLNTFDESELTFQKALADFNSKALTIADGTKEYSSPTYSGPGHLLYSMKWRSNLTTDQAIQLMFRVVPDIGESMLSELTRMEYDANTREGKNEIQLLMNKVSAMSGQKPQTQPQTQGNQTPVNENKKRRV
jgi:hypothetical protein